MNFPNTPRTLLSRLKTRAMPTQWEASWNEFFDNYHDVIHSCVRNAFYRNGWRSLNEEDANDVVVQVVRSFYNEGDTLGMDFSKGRFRQMLTTLCKRRVIDFIREQQKYRNVIFVPVEEENTDSFGDAASLEKYQADEEAAFRDAAVSTLLAALRHEVSPQVFMIFERVKILEEKPSEVAEELGIKRGVIDNSIHKALKKLREIASHPEIQNEF